MTDAAPRTPRWLLEAQPGLCPCGCVGRRNRRGFLDATLAGATKVRREALLGEEAAERPGLLQRLDARAKLAGALALVLAVALVHSPVVLAAVAALLPVAAASSRIEVGRFVRRVWLVVPLFTGLVVLPATLNLITPGEVVVGLGHPFGHELGITAQGLHGAVVIVLRVGASVSIATLLALTTPWPALLAALRALRVPRAFVLVAGMAYRYLFVLLGVVEDMYMARKARAAGTRSRGVVASRAGRASVAAAAATLFARAYAMADDVHLAMVARGWRGEARTLRPAALRGVDVLFALASLLTAVLIIGADHAIA
jgi:cobalt/nickel transport system permease protein